jgi:hypothetical protein
MKKRLLVIASLVGLSVMSLFSVTSNFVTPLSFEQKPRTYVHYPFLFETDLCSNWSWDGFGVYYQRNACDAFGCNLDCVPADQCNDCDKVTSHTVPLAQLWFGKPSFTVADTFEDGVISAPTGNPFLNSTTFTPRFSYNERGAFLGATVNRYNLGCCKDWFVSARIGLPVSTVAVNQTDVCNCGSVDPDFVDAIVTIQQQIPGNGANSGPLDTKTVRIYRMDLLSALQLPDGTPMVQYGTLTPDSTSGNTRIAGQDITNNDAQVTDQSATRQRGPVYMYKQSSGKVPFPPKGLTNAQVATKPPVGQDLMIDADADLILPADGITGLADGQWGVFGGVSLPPNTAYDDQAAYASNLGTNVAAQKQLFFAPVWVSSSASWEEIGLVVQNTIDRIVDELQFSGINANTFLAEKGIDIGRSSCRTGSGDLFLDIWGGKQKKCWFADGLIGFRFPTSSKLKCPQDIYAQPNGSNGHYGLKLGVEGGRMVRNWLGLKLEFFYTHFFKATEQRAAVFKDSKIRNIGPCVDAQVSWNTCLLYLDATFFSTFCPDLGWDFGYELYAKSKDNLSYCVSELADFAGQVKPLDACNARRGSDVQSHKLRGEIFNRWGCFQVFLGGSYIVAGKNVMKETEWHLGMVIDF